MSFKRRSFEINLYRGNENSHQKFILRVLNIPLVLLSMLTVQCALVTVLLLPCFPFAAKQFKENSSDDDGGLSKRVSGQNNLLCVASLTFSRGVVVLLDASC